MSVMFSLLLGAAAATGQSPADHVAKLDAALVAQDYKQLSDQYLDRTQSPQDSIAALDWAKKRWTAGSSAAVPFVYSRLLWSMVDGSSDPRANGLKQTAVAALLYVIGTTGIDGARCGDPSAPADRRLRIVSMGRDLIAYGAKLPPNEREQAVFVATAIEQRTAAVRDRQGDAQFLCRYGMEEITHNLRHGPAKERSAKPGELGRQIELTGDGKYVPSIRPEAIWRPEAEKARSTLLADLTALLSAPTDISAASPRKQ